MLLSRKTLIYLVHSDCLAQVGLLPPQPQFNICIDIDGLVGIKSSIIIAKIYYTYISATELTLL